MSTASENDLFRKLSDCEAQFDVDDLEAFAMPIIRDYVNAQVAAAVEECANHRPKVRDDFSIDCSCGWKMPIASSRPVGLEWQEHLLSLPTKPATQALDRIKAEGGKTAIEEADRHLEAPDDDGCSCRGHRILRQRQAQARLEALQSLAKVNDIHWPLTMKDAQEVTDMYVCSNSELRRDFYGLSVVLSARAKVKILERIAELEAD